MFGFGKKKDKKNENEALQAFKDAGLATNEVREAGTATRKENVENQRKVRASAIQKDQLFEKLNSLRKELNYNPAYGDYAIQLEDMIAKLRRMQDNVNKDAMNVVDGFILMTVNNAIDSCNRDNYIGIGAYLYNLKEFVNDRFQCGNYYTSRKFCDLMIEKSRLNVQMRTYQSQYDELVKRLEQLKNDFNKGIGISGQSVSREVADIKKQGARIKEILDQAEARIQLIDNCIGEIKTYDLNHGSDNIFDIDNIIDDILNTKKQNEIDAATTDKYNSKLEQKNRKVSSAALDVNSDAFENELPAEINDDMFKMD